MMRSHTEEITLEYQLKNGLIVSSQINNLLMVCSHERSGTHFLINSIARCTQYSSSVLNFDYVPLGAFVNFFDAKEVHSFFNSLSRINKHSRYMCASNIIKSHFPLDILGKAPPKALKIIYIYRNPVDVFISFWKFMKSQNYFEGPNTKTPLELACHIPSGRSQRYQMQNYHSYFERWANHVSAACQYAKNTNSVTLINYDKILINYAESIKSVCNAIDIKRSNEPKFTSESELQIKGASMNIPQAEILSLREYCFQAIHKFPGVPLDIMHS